MKTEKSTTKIQDVAEFKDKWTLENALYILKHPTVDSEIWAEAVEWLLLYGPKEIRELLLSASNMATSSCFPDLQGDDVSRAGDPCYKVSEIAKAMKSDIEETERILKEKEKEHGMSFFLDDEDITKAN